MAEAGFTLRAGAAGAGTPADDAGAKKTTTSRPAEAKSVVDYIGLAATASKLRADGETFVANVVEAANKYQGIDLKVEKIPGDNYEARILVNADQAIVLVFHDTFARRDMTRIPSISVMKDVIKSAQLKGITAKIISAIVVLKEEYENYETVAAGIVNSFRATDEHTYEGLSIGDFDASGELHISLNLKDVLNFAATTTGDPIAHADSGLLLYAKQRNKDNSGYGVDDSKMIPILAVTGYTDIKRVPADPYMSTYKYDPTFVITGIYGPIRTEEMAMVGVSLAADVFIHRGMWLNAFSTFTEGERNLGSIFFDPKTKKPFVCHNILERTELMKQHFTSNVPLLAIDLQEGADQFPGLKDLIANPDKIKKILRDFTGGERAGQFEIIQGETISYDGRVETAKGRVDTRAVDFLFLVDPKGGGVSHDRAASFLDYPDPIDRRAIEQRALQLEEFYNKIDLTYTTLRVFFNSDFVDGMSADLGASIHLIIDSQINSQVYDISGLKRFGNVGAHFVAGGNPAGFGGFRGFVY